MALDVWVGEPTRFVGGPAVSFEPEAYYSFIFPLFAEFAQSSGQMIGPYEGARFESSELAGVLALVDKAREMISAQPEEFQVHMGTNMGSYLEPRNEEIFCTVSRYEYLAFIEKLRLAVLEAQRTGKALVFFGD